MVTGQSSLLVLSSCISVFLYFRNCKYFSLQSIYTRVKRAKKRPWSVLVFSFCISVFLYFRIYKYFGRSIYTGVHWQKRDHGQSSVLVFVMLYFCTSVFPYSLWSIHTCVNQPWSVLGAGFVILSCSLSAMLNALTCVKLPHEWEQV